MATTLWMVLAAGFSALIIAVVPPGTAAFAGGGGASSPSHDPCAYGACPCPPKSGPGGQKPGASSQKGCPCTGGGGSKGQSVDGGKGGKGFGGRCPCITSGHQFNGYTVNGRCPKYTPRPLQPRITGNVNIGSNTSSFKVTVFGSGFDPNEGVVLTLDGVRRLGTVMTNRQGGFQLTVVIPAGLRLGTHQITATGQTSAAVAALQIIIVRGPPASPQKPPKTKGVSYSGTEGNSWWGNGHSSKTTPRGQGGWSSPDAVLVSAAASRTASSSSGGVNEALGASAGALALTGLVMLAWRKRRATAGPS